MTMYIITEHCKIELKSVINIKMCPGLISPKAALTRALPYIFKKNVTISIRIRRCSLGCGQSISILFYTVIFYQDSIFCLQ